MRAAAAGQWDVILSYLNRVPFDIADPIFGHDVSFYIFELPILEFVQGWLLSILLIALLGIIPIYAINNLGISSEAHGGRLVPAISVATSCCWALYS
ncbi:MAG: UPF0182 family protein [Chloroflexota bacterium]